MNEALTLGKKGADLIKSFESLVLKAYVDTHDKEGKPIYAIGWGHTATLGNPVVTKDMFITEKEANEIFLRDAKIFEKKVKDNVKVPLNQNQFDALVCMAYNVRTSNFKEMIELSGLNNGVYDKVPQAMMKYNVANGRVLKGLTRRRKEEGELFSTPVKS